jgi:hypothetical protein
MSDARRAGAADLERYFIVIEEGASPGPDTES